MANINVAEELEDAVLTHEFAACNHDQLLTKDQQQAIKDSAQAECDAIIAEVTTAHGIESQEQSTALSFDDMEDYLEELEDKLYDRAAQLRISFLRDAIPMYRAEAAAVRNRAYAEACLMVQLSIAMLRPFDEYKESCLAERSPETTHDDAASRRRARRAEVRK